jgi:hypothetical protein
MIKNGISKRLFQTGILGIIILVFSIYFAGCSQFLGEVNDTTQPASVDKDMTRRDYLALLKTTENHKVTVDELQEIVTNVINSTTSTARSVGAPNSIVTGLKKLPLTSEKRFASFSIGRSVQGTEEEPIELYEFAFESPEKDTVGFILASNDDRVGNVLAIAEGSLEPDNPFAEELNVGLDNYIDDTIAEYDSITEEDINAAIAKAIEEDVLGARTLSSHWSGIGSNWTATRSSSDFTVGKAAILRTQWGQQSAYNNYIMYDHKNSTHVTGCGPTAMAQIIAYHGYINSVNKPASFTDDTTYKKGIWNGTYNFADLRNMVAITDANSAALRGQVGALMWQIGKTTNAQYGYYSTGIYASDAYNAFIKLGYSVDGGLRNATNLSETSNSTTIYYSTTPAYIKSMLDKNRPIYTRGSNVAGGGGHAWVIDGYGSMQWYQEYVYNKQTGQYGYVTVTLSNCLMVHCNLGWDGAADGWYIYGIFDTKNRPLLPGNSSSDGVASDFSKGAQIIVPYR